MGIDRIRINHLASPSGVVGKPIFSWVCNGYIQSEYRIRVQNESRILWDSGTVYSSEHNSIEYEGDTLPSLSLCTLTISSSGNEASSTFITGCPELGEKAFWIHDAASLRYKMKTFVVSEEGGDVEDEGYSEAAYLKKVFRARKAVKEAFLAISGVGFYHVEINGRNIGRNLLQPAQSDYNKRAFYNVFDVSDAISYGTNEIVISLGNGRLIKAYGYDGKPKAIMLLRLRYQDGSEDDIVSDESFLTSTGPIKQNSIYEGTLYDARKKMHFTKSNHAELIEGYSLEPEMLPPIVETENIKPRTVTLLDSGNWLIDFGQNSSGTYRIAIGGKSGDTIKMRFSELADEKGLNTRTTRDANTEDVYISNGAKRIYQPVFTYHGFRYMEIEGYPGVLKPEDIEKIVFHTDLEATGSFVCSDDLLNRIHLNTRWSQRSNSMGIPTDCPQREERMGWLGDVQLASRQAVFDFDMAAFYRKFLDDIRLSQLPGGELSDVTPPYWKLYPADPVWGSAYPTLLWRMYKEYRDKQALRLHYDSVRKYVDWLYGKRAEDGTIHDLGKYGDWCEPTATYPKKTSTDFTSSWYLMKDTLTFSMIAKALGYTEDAENYRMRFDELKKNFLLRFDNNGRFESSSISPKDNLSNMTTQVLPLALHIVPENEKETALQELMKCIDKRCDFHIDCGILGLRYLFDVLIENGYDETAYRIISNKTYPGLGYMVECGATTLWERWELLKGVGMNSHNHIMYGSPNAWFYQGLLGIRNIEDKWIIHPYFPEDMSYASASCMTYGGEISVSWVKLKGKTTVEIVLPLELSAEFITPNGWTTQDSTRLSGKGKYILKLRKI